MPGNFESGGMGNIDSSLPQFQISEEERERMKREGRSSVEIDQYIARRTLDLQEGKLESEGLKKEGEGKWAA